MLKSVVTSSIPVCHRQNNKIMKNECEELVNKTYGRML